MNEWEQVCAHSHSKIPANKVSGTSNILSKNYIYVTLIGCMIWPLYTLELNNKLHTLVFYVEYYRACLWDVRVLNTTGFHL